MLLGGWPHSSIQCYLMPLYSVISPGWCSGDDEVSGTKHGTPTFKMRILSSLSISLVLFLWSTLYQKLYIVFKKHHFRLL